MKLFSSIKRSICRILRKPRTYGFGVQSPFAYNFVRNVADGKDAFLLDDFISKDGLALEQYPLRLYSLLARLSAYICSERCYVDCDLFSATIEVVLQAGYHQVKCEHELGDANRFCLVSAQFTDWDRLLNHMADDGMLVVVGLRSNRQCYEGWKALLADDRTCVSFDLYDAGVVFFDHKMFKRSYRCNYR